MINEILQRNRAQLIELNRKYKSGNSQIASLKNTIERLNKEMQESSNRLVQLQQNWLRKMNKLQNWQAM